MTGPPLYLHSPALRLAARFPHFFLGLHMLKQFKTVLLSALLPALFPATVGAVGLMLAPSASAAVIYQLDTVGSPGPAPNLFPVGLVPDPTYTGNILGDLMWLNAYTVRSGGEVINSIDLSWGAPGVGSPANGFPNWQTSPSPSSVFLYSDPNGDGNPNDAKLLAQADTTVANPGTGLLSSIAINPTELAVGQKFFVGALLRNVQRGQEPATLDFNGTTPGGSWFAIGNHGDNEPSNFNVDDLSANSAPGGVTGGQIPVRLDDAYGNWVIRATADGVTQRKIPEGDGIVGMLAVGLLGALLVKRRP
jgi:hypothetical protein